MWYEHILTEETDYDSIILFPNEMCIRDRNWLTDPTVFAVNRLDAHSDHVCYKTEAEAETGLTSLRQSLDGAWRFAWSANPAARPADFYEPDADLTAFGTIRVPGHIELQGYGCLLYTSGYCR